MDFQINNSYKAYKSSTNTIALKSYILSKKQ